MNRSRLRQFMRRKFAGRNLGNGVILLRMKSRLSHIAVAALASLVAASLLSATDAAPPISGSQTASADAQKAVKPSLQKGMSAAAVIQLIGKPEQIKSMNAPEGKAETWIYRRLLSRIVTQEATGSRDIPAFDGSVGAQMGTRPEIVYSNVTVETYQVTHLLMFNDQLVVAKQWREQERAFSH